MPSASKVGLLCGVLISGVACKRVTIPVPAHDGGRDGVEVTDAQARDAGQDVVSTRDAGQDAPSARDADPDVPTARDASPDVPVAHDAASAHDAAGDVASRRDAGQDAAALQDAGLADARSDVTARDAGPDARD